MSMNSFESVHLCGENRLGVRQNVLSSRYGMLLGKMFSWSVLFILLCGVLIPAEAVEQISKMILNSGGCATSGATNAITLSNVPGRITGVAPLAVFFDATGTTAIATKRPFHDIEYRWNFGENVAALAALPGGVNWNHGSTRGSRNVATGPVTSHVFETPGVYSVTVSATDGTHAVSNRCTQIVVQDPDVVFANANTICVGATGVPGAGVTGCPAGAKRVQESNFTAAISRYAKTGNRVLFKRGDTFSAATTAKITAAGPGTVGSFGSGNLPVVQMSGDACTLCFSSRSTPTFADWRIMDLEFNGMSSFKSLGIGIDDSGGGLAQVTVLRLTLRNFGVAIGFGADLLNYWNNTNSSGHNIDQLAIVDSTVMFGPNTQYGGYNAGNRLTFMGNTIDNGGIQIRHDAHGKPLLNAAGEPDHGSHVTRFPYLGKAIISNNSLSRPGFDRHIIKLHAPFWLHGVPDVNEKSNYSAAVSGDGYTKQVVIADNKFTDDRDPWSVAIGPQNGSSDERVRDVILERNWHVTTPMSQVAQVIRAQQVTVRNNLFQGGGSKDQVGVMIDVYGVEPPAKDVWIYNNTQYSADPTPSGQLIMVDIRNSRVSNITIKNNLAYAPKAQNPRLYANVGAANVVAANNSTDAQIKEMSPLFTAMPSANLEDWRPQAGSYAINHGAEVPVWSDLFRNNRPQKGGNDIGAVEVP